LREPFPEQAGYAVSLGYRIRFAMLMNAREAMHLLELRTPPSGHPAYRQVCQEMHRLIAEEAGHRSIAAAMSHVDHTTYELERLAAERAADARRTARPV
jgi:thymidylate synthase ThyX